MNNYYKNDVLEIKELINVINNSSEPNTAVDDCNFKDWVLFLEKYFGRIFSIVGISKYHSFLVYERESSIYITVKEFPTDAAAVLTMKLVDEILDLPEALENPNLPIEELDSNRAEYLFKNYKDFYPSEAKLKAFIPEYFCSVEANLTSFKNITQTTEREKEAYKFVKSLVSDEIAVILRSFSNTFQNSWNLNQRQVALYSFYTENDGKEIPSIFNYASCKPSPEDPVEWQQEYYRIKNTKKPEISRILKESFGFASRELKGKSVDWLRRTLFSKTTAVTEDETANKIGENPINNESIETTIASVEAEFSSLLI